MNSGGAWVHASLFTASVPHAPPPAFNISSPVLSTTCSLNPRTTSSFSLRLQPPTTSSCSLRLQLHQPPIDQISARTYKLHLQPPTTSPSRHLHSIEPPPQPEHQLPDPPPSHLPPTSPTTVLARTTIFNSYDLLAPSSELPPKTSTCKSTTQTPTNSTTETSQQIHQFHSRTTISTTTPQSSFSTAKNSSYHHHLQLPSTQSRHNQTPRDPHQCFPPTDQALYPQPRPIATIGPTFTYQNLSSHSLICSSPKSNHSPSVLNHLLQPIAVLPQPPAPPVPSPTA